MTPSTSGGADTFRSAPEPGTLPAPPRRTIYAAIDAERDRQHALWWREHDWGFGDCSSVNLPAIVKSAVLGEEVGEVHRAVLDRDSDALRRELVQVAAVAVAWLESLS